MAGSYRTDRAVRRFGRQFEEIDEVDYMSAQESASIRGDEITFTDGVYRIMDPKYPTKKATAKGVRLRLGSGGGTLVVHLKDNPPDKYDVYDLDPKDKEGLAFDMVIQEGTTPELLDDQFYILL